MIARYSRPEMTRIWEVDHKYRLWLQIEILACEAMARMGRIPAEVPAEMAAAHIEIRPDRIDALERETRHDVTAFVTSIAEQIGDAGRFLHFGITSSDIVDTALAVMIREASDLLLADLATLLEVIKAQAMAHAGTVMVGRSHGMHGEPITFGWKMVTWYAEMCRHLARLRQARQDISVGKLSGAMGTYAHLGPAIEADMCARLGLVAEPAATQVVPRDRHAAWLQTLALIAASIEKFAIEIRHLQRTEVGEVEEPFETGQKGSSSMPHKRNPIGCENLCGLSRMVRAYANTALENIPLWHERDISHSSVERVMLPDSAILVDYMLHRFSAILQGLVIHADRMRDNLNATKGTLFSQRVLLRLIEKGCPREQAYEAVQSAAMQTFHHGMPFQEALSHRSDVTRRLSHEEIEDCFDMRYFTAPIASLYARVFT